MITTLWSHGYGDGTFYGNGWGDAYSNGPRHAMRARLNNYGDDDDDNLGGGRGYGGMVGFECGYGTDLGDGFGDGSCFGDARGNGCSHTFSDGDTSILRADCPFEAMAFL